MTTRLDDLHSRLQECLAGRLVDLTRALGEITITVTPADLLRAARDLRDAPQLRFEQLSDLCGVDYLHYREGARQGSRFAVVYHLLSISFNRRVRVRVCPQSDEFPVLDSVVEIWPSANWYEREAFDLFGIVFVGHPDLRRILTDYGFVGHPFRKDFPISGNVEMRYDPDEQRVIYQPVTMEPREIVPRVVREEHYADVGEKR